MRIFIISLLVVLFASCSAGLSRKQSKSPESRESVTSNENGKGPQITVDFYKGKSFYYPLMAIWLEDETGKYIQTLFVARSVATGFYMYGNQENNKWVPGPKREPQTLPYWAHKRGIRALDGLYIPDPENPVPDAYSGATPVTGFTLISKADSILPGRYRVMLEINQNWDWNEFWTNDKFPDDENYRMSCQPAIVYEADIDMGKSFVKYKMKPVGHSHYSGKTGELFPDLSTITTALHIADSILVRVR
jgi:hypothetical protein